MLADFRIDVLVDLPTVSLRIDSDELVYAHVDTRVGGTALHFARGARGLLDLTIIGKIGVDAGGHAVRNALDEAGARFALLETTEQATGLVVEFRDVRGAGGSRMLRVATESTASDAITAAEIRGLADVVERQRGVIIDGYRYLRAGSATAAEELRALAAGFGALTVFDAVPHDLGARVLPIPLDRIVASYDVVVSEAASLTTLVDLPVASDADSAAFAHLADRLRERFPAVSWWILRHGHENMSEETILGPLGPAVTASTGYREASEHVGFGERVTCAHVFRLLQPS